MKKIISILLVAMLIIGMFPATALTAKAAAQTYTKVTTAPSDWSGKYLIVCEKQNVAFKGSLNASSIDAAGNYVSVTISNNTITADDSAQFEIASVSGGYSIKSAGGAYLGRKGTSNGMDEAASFTAATHTNIIELNADGSVKIYTKEYADVSLQYYNGGAQSRFRYYKTVQQPVYLYKLTEGGSSEPDTPPCDHIGFDTYEGEDAVKGSCTVDTKTATIYCSNCDGVVTEQQTIPAPGHNYVNGECKNCGNPEPQGYTLVTDLSEIQNEDQVIVIAHAGENYYAMPNTISSKINGTAVSVSDDVATVDDIDKHLWTIGISDDKVVTLKSGNNFLKYASGTNLGSQTSEYRWTVTEGKTENTFRFTSETSGRGLVFRASTYNQFGGYALSNATATSTEYFDVQLYKLFAGTAEPVIKGYVDGEWTEFTSITDALTASNGKLQLIDDIEEGINYSGELKLDLNGKTATNVTATKIYAYDSSAKVSAKGTGSLTTTSEVVTDNTVEGVRYIALKGENNQYTFHVLELKLNAVSLRAGAAGIYYKAQMNCDDTLKAAIEYHGTVVSINNMPGANFANETNGDVNRWTQIQGAPTGAFTTCSVFGIFKEGNLENATRGETKIYANAYIQLEGTDEIIVADTTTGDKAADQEGGNAEFDGIAWSLRDVMEKLDTMYSDMTDANKKASIVKFYENWADAMTNWSVANIAADATPAK